MKSYTSRCLRVIAMPPLLANIKRMSRGNAWCCWLPAARPTVKRFGKCHSCPLSTRAKASFPRHLRFWGTIGSTAHARRELKEAVIDCQPLWILEGGIMKGALLTTVALLALFAASAASAQTVISNETLVPAGTTFVV